MSPTQNLRDVLDNMFDARVPSMWKKISWESSTLGFWFTEVLERNSQFHSWVFDGRPKTFWMTGFFNPQSQCPALKKKFNGQSTSVLFAKTSAKNTAGFDILPCFRFILHHI